MVKEKWVALSNTTIGVFMASINGTIVLISLPPIFNGIGLNPEAPGAFVYLLWILMGYNIVTATLLVTFGRLSDIFGRVKLFNLGFAVFTAGSVLLFLTPGRGTNGALELIMFRLVQGVGAAFLFSNSAAIITDAFPYNERGTAMGINSVAALSGSFIGLLAGGVLSAIDWRFVFLVSIPFGILGTVWSMAKLKETSPKLKHRIDYAGNAAFGIGLIILLIGLTYALIPYPAGGTNSMGWTDPWVVLSIIAGIALLIAFVFIEGVVKYPMFRMDLFKIRRFSSGAFAGLFASIAMGGLMFMIVILLQGIWLPINGYSFSSTPFWAGVLMLPMTAGFMIMAPLSGIISDRRGPTKIATAGLAVTALSFVMFISLPYDFQYIYLAIALFAFGVGMGMFTAPNTSTLMSAVPPDTRGVASGMATTLRNAGQTASMAVFFTILIFSMTSPLHSSIMNALISAGAGQTVASLISGGFSPTTAIFSAFLGYNPGSEILTLISNPSQQTVALLSSNTWFPGVIAPSFMNALHYSFLLGLAVCLIAIVFSAFRGPAPSEASRRDGYEGSMPDSGKGLSK